MCGRMYEQNLPQKATLAAVTSSLIVSYRLPPMCPARSLKAGEQLQCKRMELEGGCKRCMTVNTDGGTQ